MFSKETYINRRKQLMKDVKSGVILILGNGDSPFNYPANTYTFRQDSTFRYFFAYPLQNLVGVIDIDEGKEYLFGEEVDMDDIIWTGPVPSLRDRAEEIGVDNVGTITDLRAFLDKAVFAGRKVHFTPPYRAENVNFISELLHIEREYVKAYVSVELINACVKQRSIKSEEEIVEIGKRTTIDLGIHNMHPELVRLIGKMKYRSSYGQNLLQHARETANLCGIMAAELGLNVKNARRAGLLHDIGKVPDDEPELPHAMIGMKLCEKYKEKAEVCNAVGAHHEEMEMSSLIAPIVQVCDAISGARPGARSEIVESYIKRLKEMEDIALSYPGVMKTYAIQAGRELRVIVGADKISDADSEQLSHDIAKKIQDEMTYPGQVKITVIRETRAISYAK